MSASLPTHIDCFLSEYALCGCPRKLCGRIGLCSRLRCMLCVSVWLRSMYDGLLLRWSCVFVGRVDRFSFCCVCLTRLAWRGQSLTAPWSRKLLAGASIWDTTMPMKSTYLALRTELKLRRMLNKSSDARV